MTLRFLFAALLLLAGCTRAIAPADEPAATSTPEERRWEAARLSDYRYDFEQQCFCLREQTQPVTVEVRGGRVARVVSRETGQPVVQRENLRWHTIPELFRMAAEARRNGTETKVTHDPRLGYPTRIEIGSLAADAGVIYIASNLRPL